MKKILKLLFVFVTLITAFGFYSYQSTYADEDSPVFNLMTSKSNAKVGDTITVQASHIGESLKSATHFSVVIPTGLAIDKEALAQAAQTDGFTYQLESDKLGLDFSAQTAAKIQIPFVAQTTGTFSVSVLDSEQNLVSNVLQLVGEQALESANESTNSSSATSSESQSSTSDSSSATSQESVTSSSAESSQEKSSSQASSDAQAGKTSTSSTTTKTRTARSISSAIFSVDQATSISALTYLYYYADSVGQPLTGYIQDPDKETFTVSYTLNKVSGNGPAPPQAGVSQSLGSIQTTGGNVQNKFNFAIPSNRLPSYSTAVGSVYSLRLTFADGKGSSRYFNFRLVYLTGSLSITAPDKIDFGTNLDATLTGKQVYMGKVAAGSQALAVQDTRTIPSGITMNGWNLTVALSKQMTGTVTKGVLTNSLHYLNAGTDYTLSSAASPVKKLAVSTPNTTTNISGTWDSKNGLAFEPTAGQPVAGETYTGTVTWNLQDTPANK